MLGMRPLMQIQSFEELILRFGDSRFINANDKGLYISIRGEGIILNFNFILLDYINHVKNSLGYPTDFPGQIRYISLVGITITGNLICSSAKLDGIEYQFDFKNIKANKSISLVDLNIRSVRFNNVIC